MDLWKLPKTAEIGGTVYPINVDFRDILEILRYLNDESRPLYLRWQIALGLFYDGEIPYCDQQEAMQYLSEFISYGQPEGKPGPKLMDWDQDAQMIIGDINKVAGIDVRGVDFVHWWTFLSYFYGIGEGQLSTVVSIRSKQSKGKKLEKWEQDFFRENKDKVNFRQPVSAEKKAAQIYFDKWLGGDP